MNCARIIYGNQVATNGVVHVIDRVISSVGNTIQEFIEVSDDLTTLSVSMSRKMFSLFITCWSLNIMTHMKLFSRTWFKMLDCLRNWVRQDTTLSLPPPMMPLISLAVTRWKDS